MPSLYRIITKLPLPQPILLNWGRYLLEHAYARNISVARRQKNKELIFEIESNQRFEIELHEEDEDAYITRRLISKARRLRVPIPHRRNSDGLESEHWYESYHTGRWHLTETGIATLRNDIRNEIKARHESKLHWVAWLSAITGVIGAITGLIAVYYGLKL